MIIYVLWQISDRKYMRMPVEIDVLFRMECILEFALFATLLGKL